MRAYKNRNLFIALLMLLSTITAFAQTQDVKERIYVDVNSRDLLVGETLQYSTYCLSDVTNKTSPLSKFLYVELIGENGVIFQRKHALENGKANGEFFIPSNIETGEYYLVAYTRWMLNFDNAEKVPLVFINPYKGHDNPANQNNSLQIEFSTVSGELVAEDANQLFIRATRDGKPAAISGRIVGSNGQQLASASTDAKGLGSVEISPEKDNTYQLLIENNEGGFEFFDLPKPIENGVGLSITHSADQIELKPVGATLAGQLQIEHQGKLVYDKKLESSYPLRIKRSELPKDVMSVSFTDLKGVKRFIAPLFNTLIEQSSLPETLETRTTASVEQQLPEGNYSISVRRSFASQSPQMHSIFSKANLILPGGLNYSQLQQMAGFYPIQTQKLPEGISYMPEYRYQLLQGKLIADSAGVSVEDKNIVLSLTGEESLNMSFARTDANGEFLIEYQTINRGKTTPAHLTIPEYKHEYSIEVMENFKQDHQLTFNPVRIDTSQLAEIRERSIISQLENAYFTPDIDSTEIENTIVPTINTFNATYKFDDYVRFRTLKEHFVEYIPVAGVRERRGIKRFVVYSLVPGFEFDLDPLVLLDGVPVNGNDLLEFSPYRIESVSTINKRYFFGSIAADGVISLKTIEGNLGGFNIKTNHLALDLLTPLASSGELAFDKAEEDRIPDSRIQLLWKPTFEVKEDGIQQIQFNTSDIEGEYDMVIEGFTKDGIPVSIIKKFTVKGSENEKG